MEMRQVSIEDVVKFNPLFDRHTWFSEDRDKFFAEFEKDEDGTIGKWTEGFVVNNETMKSVIFTKLPVFVRKILIKVIK